MYRHIVPAIVAVVLALAMSQRAAAQPYPNNPQQQLAAAREQLRAAEADIDRFIARSKEDLVATDPQYAKLHDGYVAAQQRRDATRERLMTAYVQSPEYVEGQEAIRKAERRMTELTDARDTAQEEFETSLNTAWETRAKLRSLQQSRVDGAPELKDAEQELRHAKELQDAYWDNYAATTLSHDSAWLATTARRDSASHAVETAQGQVSAMRKQAAANRPQRQYAPRAGRSGGTARRSSSMGRR